ncbi:hypothetical protein RE628_02470 [Paenibacillus sp. D2_2]|uniref:hypothetical protein n=1 Tax=Paenibacillus sp. D2_2 TaxID=3073092 RepID=UPI0028153651|nr:hypothetical protein [Paenibacillus sp. D2_2]WMT41433.1 hypothetical protein RE628_02470 [Paenibacillus sp. D2_2]
MMGRIAAALEQRGFSLQRIHQPLDQEFLEGIIVKDLSFGIVDGDAWTVDAEPAERTLNISTSALCLMQASWRLRPKRSNGYKSRSTRLMSRRMTPF